MAIKESILPEFEHEMETKPHPKSRSLGELTSHLVDLPRFVPWILESESFDPAPPEGERYTGSKFESADQMLAGLDENVGQAPAAIVAALRTFLLNHMIHHRGQLTVYLRLQNVPLPSVYGPTADQP